jgi:hypothetical protein
MPTTPWPHSRLSVSISSSSCLPRTSPTSMSSCHVHNTLTSPTIVCASWTSSLYVRPRLSRRCTCHTLTSHAVIHGSYPHCRPLQQPYRPPRPCRHPCLPSLAATPVPPRPHMLWSTATSPSLTVPSSRAPTCHNRIEITLPINGIWHITC